MPGKTYKYRAMIRFGIVSERDDPNGKVKVEFAEDGIVSDWLPVVVSRALNDKFFSLPDVNEHVACVMDENLEEGVVLGAIYDSKQQPAIQGADITAVQFQDGTKVSFDRATGVLTIETTGDVNMKAPSVNIDGDLNVDGDLDVTGDCTVGGDINATGNIGGSDISAGGNISANGDITAGLSSVPISLLTHKHPTAALGPPSPPIP